MGKKNSIWQLIRNIFSFFIERRRLKREKEQERFNAIQEKLDKEYKEIQERNELKGINDVKDVSDKLNNMF